MNIPLTIGGCKLVEYNAIDSRHSPTAQTTMEIAGDVCGPAHYLAICQDDEGVGYYLFFCNKKWIEWNDIWFEELLDAKGYAEQEYSKSSDTWVLAS